MTAAFGGEADMCERVALTATKPFRSFLKRQPIQSKLDLLPALTGRAATSLASRKRPLVLSADRRNEIILAKKTHCRPAMLPRYWNLDRANRSRGNSGRGIWFEGRSLLELLEPPP
jgi:hypothetical protein